MSLDLQDEILRSAGLTEAAVKSELAIALFQRERITLGQAAMPAELPQLQFQRILAQRGIPIHHGLPELEQDLVRAQGSSVIDRRIRHISDSQPRRRS